jgi:hypothetical protein
MAEPELAWWKFTTSTDNLARLPPSAVAPVRPRKKALHRFAFLKSLSADGAYVLSLKPKGVHMKISTVLTMLASAVCSCVSAAGAYTAVVHGKDETTGVGLVEAYSIL